MRKIILHDFQIYLRSNHDKKKYGLFTSWKTTVLQKYFRKNKHWMLTWIKHARLFIRVAVLFLKSTKTIVSPGVYLQIVYLQWKFYLEEPAKCEMFCSEPEARVVIAVRVFFNSNWKRLTKNPSSTFQHWKIIQTFVILNFYINVRTR